MIALIPNLLALDTAMKPVATRFAKAFERAWDRIPADAKATIRDYFRKCPGRVYMCYRMDFGDHPREPWGRCSWYEDKTVLTFLAPFVEGVQPLEKVSDVIAHELAHCFTRGSNTWVETYEIEEANVRHLCAEWGFGESDTDAEAEATFENWRKTIGIGFREWTEVHYLRG